MSKNIQLHPQTTQGTGLLLRTLYSLFASWLLYAARSPGGGIGLFPSESFHRKFLESLAVGSCMWSAANKTWKWTHIAQGTCQHRHHRDASVGFAYSVQAFDRVK